MNDPSRTPRYKADFPAMLDRFDIKTLENEAGVVFGLAADLRLIYFNPAWQRFATANGGEPAFFMRFRIDTPIAIAMDASMQDYYLGAYRNALRSCTVWEHDYECSSHELYRRYHLTAYPLRNRRALIVINSLVKEQPHDARTHQPSEPDRKRYTRPNGLITMCSHCRRVQRVDDEDVWDWVPRWVERMPHETSHSLCPPCFDYYYKHHV